MRLERVLFLLVAVLSVIAIGRATAPNGHCDTDVFLQAGARFLEGSLIYRESDGSMPFKYAPPIALVFVPYALLPDWLGRVAWNLTSVVAFALAARYWVRALGITRPIDLALATGALATSLYLELHMGQIDLVMLALATGAFRWREDAPIRAGLCFTVLVLIKPPALLMALPLALHGRRRVAVALTTGIAAAVLVLVVVLRDGSFANFIAWREIMAATTPTSLLHQNAQSFLTIVHEGLRFEPPVTAADALPAQLIAIALFAAPLVLLRKHALALTVACLLGSALLSPNAWRANYVLLWPAFLAVSARRDSAGNMLFGAVFLLQLLLANNVLSPEGTTAILLRRPFAWMALLVLAQVTALTLRSTHLRQFSLTGSIRAH